MAEGNFPLDSFFEQNPYLRLLDNELNVAEREIVEEGLAEAGLDTAPKLIDLSEVPPNTTIILDIQSNSDPSTTCRIRFLKSPAPQLDGAEWLWLPSDSLTGRPVPVTLVGAHKAGTLEGEHGVIRTDMGFSFYETVLLRSGSEDTAQQPSPGHMPYPEELDQGTFEMLASQGMIVGCDDGLWRWRLPSNAYETGIVRKLSWFSN